MKAPLKLPRFASKRSGIILSIIFAIIFSFLGNIEYILPFFKIELNKPSRFTLRLSPTVYLHHDTVKSEFTERWFLLRYGETILTRDRFNLVRNFIDLKQKNIFLRLAGFAVTAFILTLFLSYIIRTSWPGHRRYLRTEISCYFLIFLGAIGIKAFFMLTNFPFTLLPVASIPAVITIYTGRRIGIAISIITAYCAGMLLDIDAISFIFFLIQNLSTIPVLKFTQPPKKFKVAGATALITFTGILTVISLTMILSSHTEPEVIRSWRNSQIMSATIGGALCYPVIWFLDNLIRPLLGIVSIAKLNELQTLQHELLKKLQVEAPATWEHSRAIANLAEEAAAKIGADALLTRVGAYFHDIGKAAAPEFFYENYSLRGMDGEGPHKNLPPEKSAELIIDHVTQGVKILRSNNIPERVVEFVYMHHGTNTVEYFWRKYNELNKDLPESERLPKSQFTYPGIKPQSPETAILMLADSIEATSRTISSYTFDEIEKVVSHVLLSKILDGQLEDSGLVMENMRVILRSFVDSIHFSHHSRIKYQWQQDKEANATSSPRNIPPVNAKPASGENKTAPANNQNKNENKTNKLKIEPDTNVVAKKIPDNSHGIK